MRISDWSSDVCSSDLGLAWEHLVSWMENGAGTARSWARRTGSTGFDIPDPTRGWRSARALRGGVTWRRPRIAASKNEDRKSVVSGKSVSVRVDLGGRRIIKIKKT